MPHFFEKRDPWGHGLALWVLALMALILPLAGWSVLKLRMDNDVEHWLSDDNLQTKQYGWYKEHFGNEESFLLSWDGSGLEDPRIEQLASKLIGRVDAEGVRRGGLDEIESVRTPGQLIQRMIDLKIDEAEARQRVIGVLAGPGPIWCQLSTAGLRQKDRSLRVLREQAAKKFGIDLQFADRFGAWADETNLAAAEDRPEEPVDASGTLSEVPTATFAEIAPHDFQVAWPHMHANSRVVSDFIAWAKGLRIPVAGQPEGEPLLTECYQHHGQPAAIAVVLSEAGKADRAGTLEKIRLLASEVRIPADALHMGGTPVATAVLNHELGRALWNPTAPWYLPQERSVFGFSWAVGLLLAFWLLKSARLAVIVLAVSYLTTLATVALVPATGGRMNMVLMVMPTLLLVVTMSGAVHIANYWQSEMSRNPRTAIVNAVLTARIPCLMAAVTTSIGLASLMTSHLAPVRDFGFFSAVGTLLSVGAVLYGIPALLQVVPLSPKPVTNIVRRPWTKMGRVIVRYSTAICLAWVAVSAFTLYGLTRFKTETKTIRYFPEDSRLVSDYRILEDKLAGIVPVETVITFDQSAREDLNFTQRMEIVRSIEKRLRDLPEVSGTLSMADFQPQLETPGEDASLKDKLSFNARAKAAEAKVRKDSGAATLYRISDRETEFNRAGDELWRITSQVSLMGDLDYQDLTRRFDTVCRSVTKYHAGTRHVVTGMVPLFQATQQAIIDSLINSFLLAFALIAAVMIFIVRDLWAGLLSMLPNVLPIGVVFGAISWQGIPVDVGTLITASVALGIAVDGTLHLLTWYRDGLIAGLSRRRAIVKALENCGPALWQTSAMISIAMLMLIPAQLLLISRFGWLMCSLVLTAMVADLVLTPAMLAGPMGWMIYRGVQKQRNRLKAVIEDPNPDDVPLHKPHVMPPKPQIAANSRPDTATFDQRDQRQRKRRK